jgi:hypothetical protein
MNYAIVVLAFVILLSLSYYCFSARRWFNGPKQISIEEQEREQQLAALGQDEKLRNLHAHIHGNGEVSDMTTPDSASGDLKYNGTQVEQVDRA